MDLMVGEKGAREASAASKDPKLSSPFTWRKFFAGETWDRLQNYIHLQLMT